MPIENDVFNGLFGSGSLFGVPSLFWWTLAAIGARLFRASRRRASARMSSRPATTPRAARAIGIEVLRLRFIVHDGQRQRSRRSPGFSTPAGCTARATRSARPIS